MILTLSKASLIVSIFKTGHGFFASTTCGDVAVIGTANKDPAMSRFI